MHRGKQYARAIKLYYKKFNAYPANVDALVKTNEIRFLRKKYIDPTTGKDEWKVIHLGQNKAPTAFGFFGVPIGGAGMGGGLCGNALPSSTGSSSSSISSFREQFRLKQQFWFQQQFRFKQQFWIKQQLRFGSQHTRRRLSSRGHEQLEHLDRPEYCHHPDRPQRRQRHFDLRLANRQRQQRFGNRSTGTGTDAREALRP
jgi:hypothetical protein